MPTIQQEKLADGIIANSKRAKPLNKKELLVSVGYAESTASVKPKEIIEQKGVIEALETRGFSVAEAKQVVGSILTSKKAQDKDKLKAADMVFKVHGAYVPEMPKSDGDTYNFFLNPRVQEATGDYEQRLKEALAASAPTHA